MKEWNGRRTEFWGEPPMGVIDPQLTDAIGGYRAPHYHVVDR